ncbi:MAG: formaldehyde-activating enzyme [Methylotenera sp.]
MKTLKINKVLVGEALVGEGNEVAHVDLIMGPRGSAVETAFCLTLTNQKRGDNALLAVIAPNLMTKPPTVMYNKVDIKNAKQAVQMFGAAQCGIAEAVADSVKEGLIPIDEADDVFICVGVFIHWDAEDNTKIQDWNYEATKLAIKRAVEGSPTPAEVVEQEFAVKHPLAAHAYFANAEKTK